MVRAIRNRWIHFILKFSILLFSFIKSIHQLWMDLSICLYLKWNEFKDVYLTNDCEILFRRSNLRISNEKKCWGFQSWNCYHLHCTPTPAQTVGSDKRKYCFAQFIILFSSFDSFGRSRFVFIENLLKLAHGHCYRLTIS